MTGLDARIPTAKIRAPLPPTAPVRRRVLTDRLASCTGEARLTVLEAPAGSGKTTALACWIEECSPRHAWLALDPRDNRPRYFLRHLIRACESLVPGLAQGLDERLAGSEGREEILTEASHRFEELDETAVLIIDDYQFIENHEVHAYVTRLLSDAPPTLHLVIASREAPPLPLGRLRVQGSLAEIGPSDFRFRDEEASQLVRSISGRELEPDDLSVLNRRTEGWVAGIQLAALSLRASKRPDRFVAAFTGDHRHILDFLIEEVWSHLDDALREHLMRLSLVPRFTADLCDALGCGSDGREVLHEIDRANLFLVPLDDERRWYRFHHLFGELLRQQAERSGLDTEKIHGRAADWFREQGLDEDEFEQRFHARDWDAFIRLAVQRSRDIWAYPPDDWIQEALLQIPDEDAARHPDFLNLLVLYLISTGNMKGAVLKLQLLDDATAGAAPAVRAPLLAIRSFLLAIWGDHTDLALSLADQAFETAEASDQPTLSRVRLTRALVALYRGEALEAEELLGPEASLERREDSYFTFLGALVRRAQAATELGRLTLAERRLEALEVEQRWRDEFPAVIPQILRCRLHLMRADIERCEEALRTAFSYTEEGRGLLVVEVHLLSARINLFRGKLDAAASSAHAARQTATQQNSAHRTRSAQALGAWIDLARGDLEACRGWQELIEADGFSDLSTTEDHERLILSKVLLELGDAQKAADAVDAVVGRSARQQRRGIQVEALVQRSLCHHAAGELDRAKTDMRNALELASIEDLRLPFIEAGEGARDLAKTLGPSGLATYDPFPAAPTDSSRHTAPETPSPTTLFEPLSDRELEVLTELLAGHTNEQLAAKLFVSKNTVKTHLRNIYGKLGVHNRVQAVTRARELDLGPVS